LHWFIFLAMNYNTLMLVFYILFISAGNTLFGQSWDFVKESDGIKVYTRNEANSPLKSFKGEVTFKAGIEKVNLLVGDANNLDWWDKDLSNIKILAFEKNKFIRYYLVYNVTWPLSNRDIALEAKITIDPVTGIRTVYSKPLLNVVPEKPGLVRIKKYWQKWTVQPLDKGYVRVTLEGFVDPNGYVPAWLYNMVVTETPMRVLKALRERTLSAKPAKK